MAKITDYKPADTVRLEFEDYAGQPTGEHLKIRRIDSQLVRDEMLEYNRIAAEAETPPTDEERGVAFIKALIDEWSFDEEITIETVSGLIDLYPRTATFVGIDVIILEASKTKSAFVKKKPTTDRVSESGMEAGKETAEVKPDRQRAPRKSRKGNQEKTETTH